MKFEAQMIARLNEKVPQLIAIDQFGPQEQEGTHQSSDLDLALLAKQTIVPVERVDLAQDLANVCNKDVDLIDLQLASTVMRMLVISRGRCFFSANDEEREKFENVAFSAYARFNEERREILNDILQRGTVHAQ